MNEKGLCLKSLKCFNRTNVELKWLFLFVVMLIRICFNRTNVELKYANKVCLQKINWALIVLM